MAGFLCQPTRKGEPKDSGKRGRDDDHRLQLNNCIFHIVDNHCTPILGTPELYENGIQIDLDAGTLRQNDQTENLVITKGPSTGIKAIQKRTFFSTDTTAASSITIQPKSTAFVDVFPAPPAQRIFHWGGFGQDI